MGRVLTNNTAFAYAPEVARSRTGELVQIAAVQRFELTGQPADTETIDVSTQQYTFNTVLGGADSILIGASASDSLDNLIAAINDGVGGAGEGTLYGTGTVVNPDATAEAGSADTMVVTAKVGGTAGNSLASVDTITLGDWDAATFQGGKLPIWKLTEPNTVPTWGSEIETTPRSPISKLRQERKGTTTDLDSAVGFDLDLIIEHFVDFIQGFVFARFVGGLHTETPANDLAATGTGYSYNPIANSAVQDRSLVFARGFDTSVNNGLKQVGASSTDILIDVSGLTVETPAATKNASADVAGYRGNIGDLEIDASGNLISTTFDFTTLGLTPGQFIHIGGDAVANRFDTADDFGRARVVTVSTNEVALDKKLTVFVADAGAGKEIDVYFGRFVRNVTVDDADYLEQALQWEANWENLSETTPGADEYEYPLQNYSDQIAMNFPGQDKATLSSEFIGTDTEPPTATQKSGADSPVQPESTTAFNTSSDFARLRITNVDETGLTTDFKAMTVTFLNDVSAEKVLATLGALFLNNGNFQVELETQVLFTNGDVITAIRENRTVTMDFIIRNDDGGLAIDIPSMTLGDGTRDLPVNETVLVNLSGNAFVDDVLQTSLGASIFPFLPADA